MATTPTQRPVPSEIPQDTKFNAGKIDEFVTSMGWTYTDRFGQKHYTIEGINYLAQQAMNAFGYVILTDKTFTTGATINNPNEVLLNTADGEYYKWTSSFASGPKFVPASSTPASAGGVGPGKWLSVGDAAYKKLQVSVSSFGGKSGFSNDSSVALTAFINAINSGLYDGSEFVVDGLYKTTVELPAINRPVHLTGITAAKSAILFSGLDKGLDLDFRNLSGEMNPGTVFSKMALLTDKIATGTALKLQAETLGNTRVIRFWGSDFHIDSLTRFTANAGDSAQEWKCGIELGSESSTKGFHSVRLENFNIYGSDANNVYTTLTANNSCGIIGTNTSGVFIRGAKIYLLSDAAIRIAGQSEGWIISECEAVAVRGGVDFKDMSNPANNHSISNFHLAPFDYGIRTTYKTTPNVDTPIACYFDDIFILERSETINKPNGFIGVDVAIRFSKLTNITVWANAKAAGLTNKIAFRVAAGGNTLVGCHSHNMSYALHVFEIITGNLFDVSLCEFLDENSIVGFITPDSDRLPVGTVRTNSVAGANWKRPLTYANQFSLLHESGAKFFDVNNLASVTLKPTSGSTSQIVHYPSAQTAIGAALIATGGTETANQGSWNVRSALAFFSGSIRPETPNTGTVGVSSAPWSGGFTQTAFTVTSDERHKSGIIPFNVTSDERHMDVGVSHVSESEMDVLLNAWGDVDYFTYQFMDRVEEKGKDKARWHFGVVAQRVIDALTSHGLQWDKYAFICYDEWDAKQEVITTIPAVLDEDGNVLELERVEIIQAARTAGNKYGIRYEEALVLEAAWQRRNYQQLLARIEALEAR